MKNILTVFAFFATIFVGVQTASAQSLKQDENRPEVVAKEEARVLTEDLGLNGDQTRAVFRALVTHKVDLNKQVEGKNLNDASVKAEKNKIDKQLEGTMKKILTADQFTNWSKDRE